MRRNENWMKKFAAFENNANTLAYYEYRNERIYLFQKQRRVKNPDKNMLLLIIFYFEIMINEPANCFSTIYLFLCFLLNYYLFNDC